MNQQLIENLDSHLLQVWSRQFYGLLAHRHIYRQFVSVRKENAHKEPQQPKALVGWIVDNYIAFATTTIRKVVDPDKQTVSLRRILEEVKPNASLFTQERMQTLFQESGCINPDQLMMTKADEMFFSCVGASNGQCTVLSEGTVKNDIKSINRAAESVKKLVNERIAHDDKQTKIESFSLNDLDTAIDTLYSVFERYYGLVTAQRPPECDLECDYNCTEEFQLIWPPKFEPNPKETKNEYVSAC